MARFMQAPSRGAVGIVALFACMCTWAGGVAAGNERLLLAQAPPPGAAPAVPIFVPGVPGVPVVPAVPVIPAPIAAPALPVPPAAPLVPAGPTRLINLPKLDNKAIRELIASLLTKFELEGGYAAASEAQKGMLPVPDKVTAVGKVLARADADKKTLLLRFGFVRQAGQLPQLWSYGLTLAPEPGGPNPDADQLDDAIKAILASRQQNDANISIAELEARVIKLGYVDADSALYLLKSMGFNVPGSGAGAPAAPGAPGAPGGPPAAPAAPGAPGSDPVTQAPPDALNLPTTVGNDQLPLVIKMPGPNAQHAGLVGAGSDAAPAAAPAAGQFGLSVVMGASSRLVPETISSPTSQLMIMFNPERPEQFVRVKKAITDFIDKPARQILVEAMVLEISKDALEELGVQWNFQEGMQTVVLGALKPGANLNTVDFNKDSRQAFLNREFYVKLQALVRLGKAEVLSRPSVLTLDNRQATIRVGTDIPIATSKSAPSAAESLVSFSFQYLPTGIQLNVRPRIDNEGKEVSMLIDATVSSTVPGQDLVVRGGPNNAVLASAPTIASRRVQTYARIPDNTPLIIGGLISKDNEEAVDKIPILGDLPFFGVLFRTNQIKASKREVIIVLTPYILAEGRANFAQALPKDDEAFDSLDNILFRDAYRLRAGDVFDTGYIRTNQRLLTYRELARRIAEDNPPRVEKPPFSRILDNRIPGEQSLMNGMIYETLRRHNIGGEIVANRMLMFDQGDKADFHVRRLDSILAAQGDGKDYHSFFSMHPDRCLAITFLFHRRYAVEGDVLDEPKPEVEVVGCRPDRSDWKQILYDMNRPTADGRERHTILLKDETDVVKLSRAIVIKRLMLVNGGEARATINNYLVGRQIAIPEVRRTQTHLIEAEVARFFYHTELYYPAFEEEFEQTMNEIDKALRSGEFAEIIKPEEIPTVMRTESSLRRK